jgi:prefoldin subunit 5
MLKRSDGAYLTDEDIIAERNRIETAMQSIAQQIDALERETIELSVAVKSMRAALRD